MRGLVDSLMTAVWSRAGASEVGSATTGETLSTTLYSCSACNQTYISEQMDRCPRCDGAVEQTPNEEELGIAT